jgi:hypothetical protein
VRRAAFSLVFLVACGRGAQTETAQDVDALTRRVTSLERRMQQMEGGERPQAEGKAHEGDAKGEAKPDGDKAERPGKATVALVGDALQVQLLHNKRKLPVPGPVPPGEFEVEAVFTEGEAPAVVGKVTVPAEGSVTITCAAATKTCTAP